MSNLLPGTASEEERIDILATLAAEGRADEFAAAVEALFGLMPGAAGQEPAAERGAADGRLAG